jgi:hypothetical protein
MFLPVRTSFRDKYFLTPGAGKLPETATTTCPECGERLVAEGLRRGMLLLCAGCRNRFRLVTGPLPAARAGEPDDAGGGRTIIPLLLPVGRSGWAIAAGYMGLFSVLPGFGLAALLTSVLAWRDLKRNPRQRGMGRTIFGLVTGALSTAAYAVLLLSILAPDATKAVVVVTSHGVRRDPLGVALLVVGCIMGGVSVKKKRLVILAAALLLLVGGAIRIMAFGQPD